MLPPNDELHAVGMAVRPGRGAEIPAEAVGAFELFDDANLIHT